MRALALLPLALLGCTDETISGYADRTATYRLIEFDGAPFPSRATITFPKKGVAKGLAPCNTWTASQSAPYPWIALEAKAVAPDWAPLKSCEEIALEHSFIEALRQASLSEVSGLSLILTTEDGTLLAFRADP